MSAQRPTPAGASRSGSSPAEVRRDLERVLRQVDDERTARVAWARLSEPEDPVVAQLVPGFRSPARPRPGDWG